MITIPLEKPQNSRALEEYNKKQLNQDIEKIKKSECSTANMLGGVALMTRDQMISALKDIDYLNHLKDEDVEMLEERKIDNTKMIEEIEKAE